MPNSKVIDKIKQSIRMSVPLTVTTYKLPRSMEMQIDEMLSAYLEELGQSQLHDHLAYCLKELAVNAKKANTKRVYFGEKNLNINDRKDYEEGMRNFKKETLENSEYWLEKQKESGLFIKFLFHPMGKIFKISIKNNVEITRKEQMRVYDRIARSRAFESLEETFAEVLDDAEGAGLGIVILVLMLRKMGLDEEAYDIEGENGSTTASITVPINKVKLEKLDMLMNQIVEEIDHLPQFPENIIAIQRLINDPKSEISDIARKISTDPSLTADLLKTVNSAQFMLPNKVENIVDAVKMLGLRGIRNMLFSYGTEKILELEHYEELYAHARRVAFYSFTLARQITRSKDVLDDAYIGGILHDIGKIIFAAVRPELLNKIEIFTSSRDISPGLFEELAAGYNHAEIGARIAEKWNFSEPLIESIRYHHEPNSCKPEHRNIVYCVYFANALCAYENDSRSYEVLDHSILSKFRITSEDQLKEIQQRLSNDYVTELEIT